LPRFQPILHRSDREYWDDSAIGRVYALNGQVAAAVPYYERAVASCDGLEDLVQFSRAESDFADLLAREGRLSQACALYEKVVSRWPVASGSVTAKHAASQLNTGCTSLTPKEKSK
jgi:tetratricopeptide (TPR) repeat protein